MKQGKDDGKDPSVTGNNVGWSPGVVAARDRAARLGHPGAVVWFTGLPASGKSTIARALEETLFKSGKLTYVLDGDNIRRGLNIDLGFSPEDRTENLRRISEVAHIMADAGLIILVAFISPMREHRERARSICAAHPFLEVFIDTPLHVCQQRDPKGLYAKAKAGELDGLTGVDSPYEPPSHPVVVVPTVEMAVSDAVKLLEDTIRRTLESRG